jgi:NAD(P)-dependent dehydrogenase (short-subunit alcohol dehydrogenase family)
MLICSKTGSSSGIGEGTALKFASLGANVVITGRDELRIKNVAEKCRIISKQKAIEVKADLTKESEVKSLINKTIDEFGRLDILVNNAGIGKFSSIDDPNLMQIFDTTMNTNVRSVLFVTSLAVPYLEKSKGSIVNISSIFGLKPVLYFHLNHLDFYFIFVNIYLYFCLFFISFH